MWRISFLTPKEFSSRRKNTVCLHLDTISVQWFDHFSLGLQSNVLSQISIIESSIEKGTWETLQCLKSNINFFVFAAFNNKLWTLHHWTTSEMCSLYSLPSPTSLYYVQLCRWSTNLVFMLWYNDIMLLSLLVQRPKPSKWGAPLPEV